MSLSLIGKSISESATLTLNAKAAMLREKGEPVIHLGGGEPKTKAPFDAIMAVSGLVNTGEVRYTPANGTLLLKKSIIRYTEEFYKRKVSPAEVIASSGAKQSIMVDLQAILDPQDELLFPAPYWVSYPEMAKLCGAKPVPVVPKSSAFHPTIQEIESKSSAKTKAIIINSPNNPSGAMYPEEFIADIVAFSEKRGIYLIMDDIYHRLVFDGKKAANCYDYAKDLSDNSRLIVVNGVSKQYAMTGFRIGWAVANKELVKAMSDIQSHQTSGPSVITQVAAAAAINSDQTSVESLRLSLENNLNVMIRELNSFPDIRFSKPDGTFYCFVDFSHYNKDSRALSNYLLDKVRVVTVPGYEFGVDGYLRLSTCGTAKDITEGVQRIKWALDPNSTNEIIIGNRKIVKDKI